MSEKKPKLLFISDDIRLNTGVGLQSRKILKGLHDTGKYDIVQIAGSLLKQSTKPVVVEGIKLYPVSDAYGNAPLLRHVLQVERPDIIVAFSDPHFFNYMFGMDNEIRIDTKIILYHTWDCDPFPRYNLKYYAACDRIVTISKFSHELLSNHGVKNDLVQHGYDKQEFYPLPDEDKKKEIESIKEISGIDEVDFIVFWNNRNIDRKRPGDIIAIFTLFAKAHPNALFILNTDPVDVDGTDFIQLQNDLDTGPAKIVYNFTKLPTAKLNVFYNIADITINIAYNEGFGLSVGESLSAGTPVVATRTGGMTEQMVDFDGEEEIVYGRSLVPEVRALHGTPDSPYIYRDYVSHNAVFHALEEMYQLKKQGHLDGVGLAGADFINTNFSVEKMVSKWDIIIQEELNTPSKYEPWTINTI